MSTSMWNQIVNDSIAKDLSAKYSVTRLGFLPLTCTDDLPDEFYYLDRVIKNLPETASSGEDFRKCVNDTLVTSDELITINNDVVKNLPQSQKYYLYSVLTLIMNRYIWCGGVAEAKNYNIIPPCIAVPLNAVSEELGITPTLTHASVDLWNWRVHGWHGTNSDVNSADSTTESFSLDDLETINTLTGDNSESWFYKVMIAIEGVAGECVLIAPRIHEFYNDPQIVVDLLTQMNQKIVDCVKLIKRMYEHCEPNFFFDRLRIYLSGSKNDNLPDGVFLDLSQIGLGHKNLKLIGGSAAQSTLIQMFDTLFGVEHVGHGREFLDTMRDYMPESHRNYLKMMAELPKLKSYVEGSNNENLSNIYKKCLHSLSRFREAHLGLVHSYIMKMVADRKAKVEQAVENEESNEDDKTKTADNNAHGEKGSGGTSPVEFCQELINDTNETSKNNKIVDEQPPLESEVGSCADVKIFDTCELYSVKVAACIALADSVKVAVCIALAVIAWSIFF